MIPLHNGRMHGSLQWINYGHPGIRLRHVDRHPTGLPNAHNGDIPDITVLPHLYMVWR